jgi:hypothetical protein
MDGPKGYATTYKLQTIFLLDHILYLGTLVS